MARLLVALTALATVVGCATSRPAASSAPGARDPDSVVPSDWLDNLAPDDDAVAGDESRKLIERILAIIDQKIFDPAFKKAERDRAREQLLASRTEGQTRKTLAVAIDGALMSTGMSHLRFLRPEQLRKLEQMLATPSDERDVATVGAERAGEVGILRVKSFLVPSIRRELVEKALAQLEGSKALLIDLTGNGGGSVSSTLYLLEPVLGPDKAVSLCRLRSGLGNAAPVAQHGGFADEKNQGSQADVDFEREHGFVEWRTSTQAKSLGLPVYALIDQHCASSCDAVAAALRDHRAARLLGARTAGKLLGSVAFRSPWKGHVVLVPEGMVYSPKGEMVEGVGVAPDFEIAACAEGKGRECLDAALAIVRKELARTDRGSDWARGGSADAHAQ